MSAKAIQNEGVAVSPRNSNETADPMNGAVEKYAPVRAVPNPRKANTKNTRLMPYPIKPTAIAISEV